MRSRDRPYLFQPSCYSRVTRFNSERAAIAAARKLLACERLCMVYRRVCCRKHRPTRCNECNIVSAHPRAVSISSSATCSSHFVSGSITHRVAWSGWILWNRERYLRPVCLRFLAESLNIDERTRTRRIEFLSRSVRRLCWSIMPWHEKFFDLSFPYTFSPCGTLGGTLQYPIINVSPEPRWVFQISWN